MEYSYRYPFSEEARELAASTQHMMEIKYIEMAGRHIREAVSGRLPFSEIGVSSVKMDYIIGYAYSRMLVSALRRADIIRKYADAEAGRSAEALSRSDGQEEIAAMASRLGLRMGIAFRKNGEPEQFSISYIDFINNSPGEKAEGLVNQRLSGGAVLLDRAGAISVLERAMAREITKGLPIKRTDIPKEVLEYAKGMRFEQADAGVLPRGRDSIAWIDRLLGTPIADVRHRTVNLILAPYFVNIKGLDVDSATRAISEYIDRCKQLEPNTRVNESYIRYQCDYAKKKGLRPLSLDRAKELLGDAFGMD